MKILAIETATEACSAALYNDGDIVSRYEFAPRKHTQLILPMMDSILAEVDVKKSSLDAIAFGRGPGAFTGLRIAVGIAQGLALALDKPVIPVSTLAAMSQQIIETTTEPAMDDTNQFIPAIDARMGEVYWGRFQSIGGEAHLVGEEKLSSPEVLAGYISKQNFRFGSGWEAYYEEHMTTDLPDNNTAISDVFPSAYFVAKLAASAFSRGDVMDAADAEPVYLRNDVAKKKADQLKSV